MNIEILLIVAAIMGGLFVFISLASHMYGLSSIQKKTVGHGQHGTARWASKREIKKTYTKVPYEPKKWREDPESRPDEQGIVVGCETSGKNTVSIIDTSDVHCMMIGAAGVGKTAYWLYPNIEYACASGMSFMTTDTKGDIMRNYGSIASNYYGYNISVIDLRNPMRSHGNNLLHLVNKYMDLYAKHPDTIAYKAKAEKYAKIIAKTIILSGMDAGSFGQNAYFYDAAEGVLTASILLVAEFCKPEERHIVSVFKIIQELLAPSNNRQKNQFQTLMDLLPPDHKAKWFAGAALNTSEQSMASVMSTALSRLNAFLDSELETILCNDTEIDAERFCAEKSAIFIIMPEEDSFKYFMVSLIIQQLYREILAVADENGGKLKNRVVFYCDEFGTLPKIESAEMMFSASRSRRVSIVPIIQSLAQLEKNYGKEGAEIIVDNTQLTVFGGFAPNSETAQVLSKSLGSQTILSGSVSQSKNDPSRSLQMIERPLMTADELKSLPKGTFIVTKTGFNPIKDLKYKKDQHNKFQVLKCPWCGTKMTKEIVDDHIVGAWGYQMDAHHRFYLRCTNESCCFCDHKLPIQIVDEELYSAPPTLLFGTVDKFAMMAWKEEVGSFFAVGSSNRAPELIIQDELHLISGPLGTMVAMFETAIDYLCQEKGVRPKIVASTATIRRAREQCAALYNRDVAQFPAPGLDASDSYFARESVIDYEKGKYGRLYVGLMSSGKTKAMMEIRSIASMMQSIHRMPLSDEVKDKFWTLTAYFGSLRDLGKCRTLAEDDIKDAITRQAQRLGTKQDARKFYSPDELTSRASTTELNETLDKLEKTQYSLENYKKVSHLLLATNMISVGIDVARLNVMLLVGQPKLTSEYIQASSRVGRSFPGVAFTMYDASKSRDRSHFEQFKQYHESFYRYVEPTGATPFSKPARDRSLKALLVAMIRNAEESLRSESSASSFTVAQYEDIIEKIKNYIVARSISITARLNPDMLNDGKIIENEIDEFFREWEDAISSYAPENFSYGEKYMIKHPDADHGRLLKAYGTDDRNGFDAMTSMRNVDSTVSGNILVWED